MGTSLELRKRFLPKKIIFEGFPLNWLSWENCFWDIFSQSLHSLHQHEFRPDPPMKILIWVQSEMVNWWTFVNTFEVSLSFRKEKQFWVCLYMCGKSQTYSELFKSSFLVFEKNNLTLFFSSFETKPTHLSKTNTW